MSKVGKQQNLFSFFSKTPTKPKGESGDNKNVLSPRRSPNSGKSKSPVAVVKPLPSENGSKSKSKETTGAGKNQAPEVQLYDVVWTKLDGYPWWPAIVCNHPTEKKHWQGGKTPQAHVQFFDDPPTRAWIKMKNIKPFQGSDHKEFQRGGMFHTYDQQCYQGALEADKALTMPTADRSSIIVNLQPSDDEEESEEETAEPMDFDPDIFDDEMEDGEDNSKENITQNADSDNDCENTTKNSKASPKKGTKRQPRRASKNQAKRVRIISASSDEESGDEFKPGKSDGDDDDSDGSSGVEEDEESDTNESLEPDSPVKTLKRKRPTSKISSSKENDVQSPLNNSVTSSGTKNPFTLAVSDKTKSKLSLFSANESPSVSESSQESGSRDFPHLKLEFIQTNRIKDIDGHRKSDEDYDPKTLYIPDGFLLKQTPGMKQWWELKAKHFDVILFFKMGKFYELFHMDAVICVNELGLIFMKGDHAHCGFPEIAYDRYANVLIERGYKVARIEQTETPDMMEKRCKQLSRPTKFDKVVRREVCRVTSKGTKTYRHADGDCSTNETNYLLAIAEKENRQDDSSVYGVCFVDTSIGQFHVGQFTDDRHCSRLRTLIAHHPPAQVLYERGKVSLKTLQVINTHLLSAIKDGLAPSTEFWDSSKTLKNLAEEKYFQDEGKSFEWPEVIKNMISDTDSLGMSAKEEYDLAVRSLGAVTWYLQYSLMDEDLLSMKKFEEYRPVDSGITPETKPATFNIEQRHMVLDGITMSNLDLVENSATATQEGTLLARLDQCSTPFGKRLFRQWLCTPLCNPVAIDDRLDAVEDLMSVPDVMSETVDILNKFPDLEKLLSRIHSLGLKKSNKKHPDSRAILYEEVAYSKRKIEDFLSALSGFKAALSIVKKFKKCASDFKSRLLKKSVMFESSEGNFPDITEDLEFFNAAFDHDKARKDGTIIPTVGVNLDYDRAKSDMKSALRRLDHYLDEQRDNLSCRQIVYWGNGKHRFQMEVPETAWKRVPTHFELHSSKKGWKRYRTTEIEEMLAVLTEAEERKDSALKDTMRQIFHNFDERHMKWASIVSCLSVLDVLISLAQFSRCGDGVVCRPQVLNTSEGTEPFIEIREGRHPCISKTFVGGDFIPNDTVVGTEDDEDGDDGGYSCSKLVLVTGPNMGGKSTLMRQVGLITIMAQIGCYVPASKCRLTPIDRVFTRLGASDRIMAGESTFFVELSETSSILQHATQHSLVLVDELGRGTATFDGTAIACSVVQELSERVRCRTLFSTHYHSLVEEFSHDKNVRLGHMACMVENENTDDPSQETIIFLYKFVKGACPKSYGFNAARLASIPEEIIKTAVQKAMQFESAFEDLRSLKKLWTSCSVDSVKSLQQIGRETS
ncbi:DNA mismatch repair protein Msh6-like [Gigantopelta aegis]|uniref:DNA mismatch repair protein Msh6-like n=1 Tax=Gigantopelta aegis TaxID=1735272 RepID=UPI001B88A058|nr:DNA mismatch repair protein Msh6-like [Gigantopelta aegis]